MTSRRGKPVAVCALNTQKDAKIAEIAMRFGRDSEPTVPLFVRVASLSSIQKSGSAVLPDVAVRAKAGRPW